MNIDYSTYSFKDLIDVKGRIDAERFPENYKDLLTEIERRRRSGNFNSTYNQHVSSSTKDADDDDNDFFLEFSSIGHTKRRYTFIALFLLANIVLLSLILPKYMVKSLDSVHQYNTSLSALKCNKIMVEDEETERITTYYDLEITSGEDKFIAFDVGNRMCRVLISDFKFGDEISVWHDNGIVYQFKSESRMILSYKLLKSHIREVQTQDIFIYWFGLLVLWLVLFKSFINAIVPGTFSKD